MIIEAGKTVVGFIGTGVMGKSMAGHLLKAGYEVVIYNRTKEKAQDLITEGAYWQDSPAQVARKCQVIITMVGYPADVQEVYLGSQGIIQNAVRGSIAIDMTTSSPKLAQRIFREGLAKGIYVIDAPVSGGDVGAREAKLSIMAGGDHTIFQTVEPILKVMGRNIVYQGSAGAGQHTKMCNQIAIAGNMVGVCEAMAYAKHAGLDSATVLRSIEAGAAGSFSLSNLAPRMLANNYAPGFYVKHFIKDLTIALESATEMGLQMPGLELAKSLYEQLAAQGEENSGTQALFKLYVAAN